MTRQSMPLGLNEMLKPRLCVHFVFNEINERKNVDIGKIAGMERNVPGHTLRQKKNLFDIQLL